MEGVVQLVKQLVHDLVGQGFQVGAKLAVEPKFEFCEVLHVGAGEERPAMARPPRLKGTVGGRLVGAVVVVVVVVVVVAAAAPGTVRA